MSTIVAVKKEGIAVIGADTMSKYGRIKQHSGSIVNNSKILKIGDSYLAYCGDAVLTHVFTDFFAKYKEIPALTSTQSIFQLTNQLHKVLKEEYHLNPNEDEDDDFESSRFECLIGNQAGVFGVYAYRSVDEFTQYYSFGTGYRFALGAMRALYDTDATAEEIARAALEAAAEYDDSTGLPLELYSVKLRG